MAVVEPQSTKEAVRGRYAASAGQAACCDAAGAPQGSYYSADELAWLPEDVVRASWGNGNPLAEADLRPGEVVLDLGSGAGLDALLASRQVGPQGRVIGIDMTPEMIDLARQNAERSGVDNVEFRLGEIEALPVEDSSIDAILSNCVIVLSPQKKHVFAETFRVLKPGGRLVVSDKVARGPLPAWLREDQAAWSSCLAGALTEEEYRRHLERAGFVDIQIRRTEPCCDPGPYPVDDAIVKAYKSP